MKKYLMIALAAMLASTIGIGSALAKDAAAAKNPGTQVTVTGTVKVDGEKTTITTADGVVYMVKGDKSLTDGQKVEGLAGTCKDGKDGKILIVKPAKKSKK